MSVRLSLAATTDDVVQLAQLPPRERAAREIILIVDSLAIDQNLEAEFEATQREWVFVDALDVDHFAVLEDARRLFGALPALATAAGRPAAWIAEALFREALHVSFACHFATAALDRYKPTDVLLPQSKPPPFTLRADQSPMNPLAISVMKEICRARRISCSSASRPPALSNHRLRLVVGSLKHLRRARTLPSHQTRVLIGNLDNDLHRQFRLLPGLGLDVTAWVRRAEQLIDADAVIAATGEPVSTSAGWLMDPPTELQMLGRPASAAHRPSTALRVCASEIRLARLISRRLKGISVKGVPASRVFWSRRRNWNWTRASRLSALVYSAQEYDRAAGVLRQTMPDLFVSSAGDWTYVSHFAAARDLKVFSISTSPGVSQYAEDWDSRIADLNCVPGDGELVRWRQHQPHRASHFVVAGDAWQSRGKARADAIEATIVIFTSARVFGPHLGSLMFDYSRYLQELSNLIETLQATLERDIVIKSHPLSDTHAAYDVLADKRGVAHTREAIPTNSLSDFSLAIAFGAPSSLTFEFIAQGVPVVFYAGCLTKFGRAFVDVDGLPIANNLDELAAEVRRPRSDLLNCSSAYLDRYISGGPDLRGILDRAATAAR